VPNASPDAADAADSADAVARFALRVRGVTKRFGEHTAVSSLSFDVPAGAVYGILGPNGAGKSTTLRMVNDILAPDEGEIRLLGGLRPGRQASARIGYLPEERGLYPKMRVLDTLQFFGELRGLHGRTARARGQSWLERLEIADWRTNMVQDLSKGMQQKVQFITALLHEPDLLILDEPWSGLDPINADVLRDIVLEQKSAGRTILFSTHLMEQAEKICDHVCIIARGKKVLDGVLSEIKERASGGPDGSGRDRRVTVVFAGADARARAESGVLRDASMVENTRERGHRLEIAMASDVTSETFLARLVADGVGLRHFELLVPTLHQIFVDKVGAEAEATAAAAAAKPEDTRGARS
jgi:ABC-2 type transport system ATP-binding protein